MEELKLKEKDLVSIIVPSYNHEKYIEDCLMSISAQTYQNIELIIIDDCSSDNTFEVIKNQEEKLKARFSNVIIDKNEVNLGVTKTLNKLIGLAKGQYIKALASDDMLTTTAIEELVEFAKSEEADLYFSNMVYVPEDTKFENLDIANYKLAYETKPLDGRNLTGDLIANDYMMAPGVLVPKKTYEKYGLYNENYIMEDYDFWLKISTTGCFKYFDKPTVFYRENANSLSRFDMSEASVKKHQRFHKDLVSIYNEYKEYANDKQRSSFYNNILELSIGVGDKESIKSTIQDMKEEKIKINKRNQAKLALVKLGLFEKIKAVKH